MADSVRMKHPNGTVVVVRQEKQDQLKAMGFKSASGGSQRSTEPAEPASSE